MHSTTELTEQLGADLAHWYGTGKRRSFLGVEAFGLPFLDFNSVKNDVIKVTLVVEGSDTDLPPGEGLVDGRFYRLLHIIKVDVDFSGIHISHDLEIVKLAVLPRNALLGEDQVLPGGMVDNEDLA